MEKDRSQAPFNLVTRLLVGYNSADVLDYSYISSDVLPTLLVDNESNDQTGSRAESLGYQVLRMGVNAGYSRAINAGLRQIKSEFALISNPDLRIVPSGLAALFNAAMRYPDANVFVPRVVKSDGVDHFRYENRFETRAKYRVPPGGDACIAAVSGAALLVRRQEFLTSGGFDENIFLYFEDDELGMRYRKKRQPIIFVADARAEHLGDKSSASSAKLDRLKHKSFGWSWAYVMTKYQTGSMARELATIAGKLILHVATFQGTKFRRDAAYLVGFISAMRGQPAPFPDTPISRHGGADPAHFNNPVAATPIMDPGTTHPSGLRDSKSTDRRIP
jgi:GT2 family glycosyltransferase